VGKFGNICCPFILGLAMVPLPLLIFILLRKKLFPSPFEFTLNFGILGISDSSPLFGPSNEKRCIDFKVEVLSPEFLLFPFLDILLDVPLELFSRPLRLFLSSSSIDGFF
jgi:hypothetical protein